MKKIFQNLLTFARQKKQIYLFDFIIAYVGITSIIALSLLWAHVFSSLLTLVLSTIVIIFLILIARVRIILQDKRFGIWLLPIILIAVLFRYNPSLYLAGGQDQGLYISMSQTYETYGQTVYPNETSMRLNTIDSPIDSSLLPEYAGVDNINKTSQIVPFYPLHPLWMALFGKVFGSDNRVYSIVFFALISLIGFYLTAYRLSNKNKNAGYIAALLFALNPLHVFLSKFPTTEITAFAFIILSFYYSLKFYQNLATNKYDYVSLFLSLLCINAFMYTRMSIFLYVPFIYGLIVLGIVLIEKTHHKMHLWLHLILFALTYGLSLIFYFYNNHILFVTIYGFYIGNKLGDVWYIKLLFIFICAGGLLVLLLKYKPLRTFIKQHLHILQKLPFIIAIGLIIVSLYNFYSLGFGARVLEHPRLAEYDLVGKGIQSIAGIQTYVIILYASPAGFILFLSALYYYSFRKKTNLLITLFLLFLVLFWGYVELLSGYVFYQYYYARYLLTEIVPFIIVILSVYSIEKYNNGKYLTKIFISILIVCSTFYFIFFSSIQLFRNEGPELSYYDSISSQVSENDLIISDLNAYSNEVLTPLQYFYGKHIVNYNIYALSDYGPENLEMLYDDIYLITDTKETCESFPTQHLPFIYNYYSNGLPHIYRGFTNMTQTPLVPYSTFFIPSSYVTSYYDTYICKYDISTMDSSFITIDNILNRSSGLHADGWTTGNLNITNLDVDISPDITTFVINTYNRSPIIRNNPSPEIVVEVNDIPLQYLHTKTGDVHFVVPKGIDTVNSIQIQSETFIPTEKGVNNDPRELGLDIESLYFQK